jgi:hypothetical protein
VTAAVMTIELTGHAGPGSSHRERGIRARDPYGRPRS